MRLSITVEGDLSRIITDQVAGIQDGLAAAVHGVARNAQAKLRRQVEQAGLGNGLAKAWRLENYPRGKRTLRPASLVYSKSEVLHAAFAEGAAILPRQGRFLVIPLEPAVRAGFAHTDRTRKGGPVPGGQKRRLSRLDDAAEALGADVVSATPSAKGTQPKRGEGKRRPQFVLFPAKSRAGALLAVLKRPGERRGTPWFLLLPSSRNARLLDLGTVQAEAAQELRAAVQPILEG